MCGEETQAKVFDLTNEYNAALEKTNQQVVVPNRHDTEAFILEQLILLFRDLREDGLFPCRRTSRDAAFQKAFRQPDKKNVVGYVGTFPKEEYFLIDGVPAGLPIYFGSSEIDSDDAEHIEKLIRGSVFRLGLSVLEDCETAKNVLCVRMNHVLKQYRKAGGYELTLEAYGFKGINVFSGRFRQVFNSFEDAEAYMVKSGYRQVGL